MAEVATNGSAAAAEAVAPAAAAAVFTGLKVQVNVVARRAEEAVVFYKAAFAAEEVARSTHPKRKGEGEQQGLLCAELKIGATALLICDQAGDHLSAGASGTVLRLETDDVKAAAAQVSGAGSMLQREITEDGDELSATLVDPFGVTWVLASSTSAKNCA